MSGGRTKFRYQTPYKNTYRVGEVVGTQKECVYDTIQAAINAAVADGYNSAANPALIEIYPKTSGAYVENLTLNAGVSLVGMDAQRISIVGSHTWAPVAGTAGTNRITLENLAFNGAAGAPNITFGGTNAARLTLKNTFVNRESLDDGLGCIVLSNTNNSARVTMIDSGLYHFANAGGGYAFDMQRGRLNMMGNCEIFCEGPGGVIPFALDNNANINARGGSYFTDTFFSQSGATIFEINSNGVFLNLVYFTCQSQGGSVFQFNADGVVIAATCALLTNSAPVCDGAGNGTIRVVNPVFNTGDAAGSTYGANYGFNQIPDNVNPGSATIGLRAEFKDGYWMGYVGYEFGFPSIQSAVDQLFNYAGGGYFKVVLADGTGFTENVLLRGGCILMGSSDADIFSIQAPTRIDGTVSFIAGNGGPDYVFLRNIQIDAQAGGRAFEASDNGVFFTANFQNCDIKKNGDAAVVEAMLLDGSGGGQGQANFLDCAVKRTDADVGVALSLNTISIAYSYGCYFQTNGVGGGLASNNRAVRVVDSRFDCDYGNIETFSEDSMEIVDNTSSMNIRYTNMNIAVERGEVFRFTGAGFVQLIRSNCFMSNILPGSVVARDGQQATGNFAFSGNVYAPGDGIEINGVNFINGVDFVVAGTTAGTVANIAAAINASANPSIQNVVYAIANGTTLEIYSWNYSAASNAITISVVGTAPALASGATLTGGVTGAGGLFLYDGAFGRNLIQNTLNVQQFATTLVAI